MRDSAFEYCDSLSEVTLRPDVTYIPAWCFAYCDSLAKVNIPASVTGISSSAFNGCINLSVVNYGGTKDEWDEIKNGAFGLLVIVNYNVQ